MTPSGTPRFPVERHSLANGLQVVLQPDSSLPLVAMSTRLVLGSDLLAEHGVDWKAYGKLVGQRPSAQRVDADRKADQERMAAAARQG